MSRSTSAEHGLAHRTDRSSKLDSRTHSAPRDSPVTVSACHFLWRRALAASSTEQYPRKGSVSDLCCMLWSGGCVFEAHWAHVRPLPICFANVNAAEDGVTG